MAEPAPNCFRLVPTFLDEPEGVATACIQSCPMCGAILTGMGGPSDEYICMPCGKAIMNGKVKGPRDVT